MHVRYRRRCISSRFAVSAVGLHATLLHRSLTDVLASWPLTYAYTDYQPHTHSTTSMYVSQQRTCNHAKSTLLQHPAAEFRRTKKKVAWCDCDNSPPPFFPRLLLCGEIMETDPHDCGEI